MSNTPVEYIVLSDSEEETSQPPVIHATLSLRALNQQANEQVVALSSDSEPEDRVESFQVDLSASRGPENKEKIKKRADELHTLITAMYRKSNPNARLCAYFRILGDKEHRFRDFFWASLFPEMRSGLLTRDHQGLMARYMRTYKKVERYYNAYIIFYHYVNTYNYNLCAVFILLNNKIEANRANFAIYKRHVLALTLFKRFVRELFGAKQN